MPTPAHHQQPPLNENMYANLGQHPPLPPNFQRYVVCIKYGFVISILRQTIYLSDYESNQKFKKFLPLVNST